ncbi:PQQ-binding-like beta-propeller repeat protein [Kitasatospora sp. NPDC059795]|uniref:outer membrane protein assembly factor BamB family protein n=1 Tax=Kitasatospora sp. NPDC059795 TaxID=3346949 RepID=UPI0036686D73
MNRSEAGEPRQLGPYRLVGRLPDGMLGGPVHLGRGPGGVRAAVTAVPDALAQDPRFRADVGAALKLGGPGLAPLLGADLAGPTPWLAETFVPAVTLRQAVEQYGPLPWPTLAVLARGLAQALASVHATGFAHGALTPNAVLLAVPAPLLPARVSGAAAQQDDLADLAAVLEFGAGGYVAPASVLMPLLREAVEEFRAPAGQDAVRRLVALFGDPPAEADGWLPPPLAAAAAAVGKTPGIARRTLLLGAAGGAVAVAGLATALVWPRDSAPKAPGGAAAPPSPGPASPSPSPSPTDVVRIELTGTPPTPAWQIVLDEKPSDLAASDQVIAVASDKSTRFLDRAGKPVGDPHQLTVFDSSLSLTQMTYANGTFFVLGMVRGQQSALAALDGATGTPKWAVSLPAALGDGNRPVDVAAAGDTVYVSAGRQASTDDDTYTGVLAAFDVANGDPRWKTSGTDLCNVLIPPTGHRLLAASAVSKPDGQVVVLDAAAKGARGWQQAVPHGKWYFQNGPAMTCWAGGRFVFGVDRIVAVDPETGKQAWDLKPDDQPDVRFGTPFASPDGATVYIPVGQDLCALDAADGRVKWVAVLPAHVLWEQGLSLSGTHARCTADTVLATDSQENLWAIDAATGKARWKYNDPAAPRIGLRWTVGGDRVYVSANLTLTAIAAHG